MRTGRLEALSDGVLAIIITIMVLELKVPEGHRLTDLIHSTGVGLLSYLLSFVYVGIYWNNHHHMFHLIEQVTGGILWANLGLLFALSLLPFTTAWVDESRFAPNPIFAYGLNLLAAAIAYFILQAVAIRAQGPDSPLRRAVGTDRKGKLSALLLVAGLLSALAPAPVWIALSCFAAVAVLWTVPDPRIARAVAVHPEP
ncbi:TMEM175 family protein [Actinoplanes sp. HUAS TT8]|uniref:TMEM175 family protein n=1 Tax=Actinoplanes sp. HUAS TT8 TaxID=3447453 RepID=UPI003F526287